MLKACADFIGGAFNGDSSLVMTFVMMECLIPTIDVDLHHSPLPRISSVEALEWASQENKMYRGLYRFI